MKAMKVTRITRRSVVISLIIVAVGAISYLLAQTVSVKVTPGTTVTVNVTISAIGGITCGAPAFSCSISNIAVAISPPVTPPFTGSTGAGAYNANPAPGNPSNVDNAPLLRVTDNLTNNIKHTFAPTGGGTDDHSFNSASPPTWITYQDSGGFFYFNSCTLSIPVPTCGSAPSFSSRTFTNIQTQPEFSADNATRFYYLSNAGGTNTGPLLTYADVGSPGVAHTLFDYSTCSGWNASNIFNSDSARGNNNDTAFATSYAVTALQGYARQTVVYVPVGGSIPTGCYMVDSGTTAIYGPGGLLGHYPASHGTFAIHQVTISTGPVPHITINPNSSPGAADKYTITALSFVAGVVHATYTNANTQTSGVPMIVGETIKISGTTNYNSSAVTIASATPTTATWNFTCTLCGAEGAGAIQVVNDNNNMPYVWTPNGALDILPYCPVLGNSCSGHYAPGNLGLYNNYDHNVFAQRLYTVPNLSNVNFPSPNPCGPAPAGVTDDWHGSMQYSAGDTTFLMGANNSGSHIPDYTWPCQDEIVGILPGVVENVKRFSFTYQVPTWQFSACFGVSTVSWDGNWVMFNSTMQDNLGTDNGLPISHGTVCNGALGGSGGNARADIFLADLRGQ